MWLPSSGLLVVQNCDLSPRCLWQSARNEPRFHTVTLTEARQKALECRKLCREGSDPIDLHRSERAAQTHPGVPTFSECAELHIQAHESGWRNLKHVVQWRSILATYADPVFGKIAVSQIDLGLVMQVIEPIGTKKTETASRVRGRIESVLDWATVRGYRTGDNPARWRGHLEALLPARSRVRAVRHHAALPYSELPAFMVELRKRDAAASLALQFLILTASRTGEVIGADWSEIDFERRIWVVPAERMKAGKEHRVPLSDAAVVLLQSCKVADRGAVFVSGKRSSPLSNIAMLVLLKRMKRQDITAHGFRSTFRDWVAEKTEFPSEMAEMALAHTVSDKVEAAYRRGDMFERRRALMQAWANFCS